MENITVNKEDLLSFMDYLLEKTEDVYKNEVNNEMENFLKILDIENTLYIRVNDIIKQVTDFKEINEEPFNLVVTADSKEKLGMKNKGVITTLSITADNNKQHTLFVDTNTVFTKLQAVDKLRELLNPYLS